MRNVAAPFWLAALCWLAGCASEPSPRPSGAEPQSWPTYTLEPEAVVPLSTPGGIRFDASALLRTPDGALLTLNDRGPELFEIRLDAAQGSIEPHESCFTPEGLAVFAAEKHGRYDCEGLAQDAEGRIYLCEEGDRWILRCDARNGRVERLPIDWTPVASLFSLDANASWEGIAIGGDRLYVANERSEAAIIVVDLNSLKVLEHFAVRPRKFSMAATQYSDLCWYKDRLYVLCRQQQVVLEVNPHAHTVLAEFDYEKAEHALGYTWFLAVGLMEGLSVDQTYIWLLTDNNGLARGGFRGDMRPTLLRCRWPHRD